MKAKQLGLNLALAAIVAISAFGVVGNASASGVPTGKGGVSDAPCGTTLTLNPDGDTTLFEGGGVVGAGGFRYLIAQNPGPQRRPLLHFNIGALPTPNICDARLALYMFNGAGAPIENISAQYIMGPWAEAFTVWPGPPIGPVLSTTPVGMGVGFYTWNVTNAVINWKTGAVMNNGVAMIGQPGAPATRVFYSREMLPVGLQPQLIIHY
jgi:hypothetical protein